MQEVIRPHENGVLFNVSVKPNSRKQTIKTKRKTGFIISVTSAAVGGSATRELLTLLKSSIGSDVSVYQAHKNHEKTLFAADISIDAFKRIMNIPW
jgi:uncharacterized protein (TIGR00251 family)